MRTATERGESRPARLTRYRDGPAVLRGGFRLVDGAGGPVTTLRRTVALCRCGRSRLGVFCDGTHRSAGFRAPAEAAREVGRTVVVPLAPEG